MNLRLKIISLAFILMFASVIARLFYWQIIKGAQLSEEARRQYQLGKTISAQRGNILASDGSFLAGRVDGWLLYAEIPKVKKANQIADKLAEIFVNPEDFPDDTKTYRAKLLEEADRIKTLLVRSDLEWVPIGHKLDSETKNKIIDLDFDGLGFDREDLRVYPEASSAAQLLGFVGKDSEGSDKGYFGIEGFHDLGLSGKPGYIFRDSDVKGSPIVLGKNREVDAIRGVDLQTHIRKGMQLMIEDKLKDGIERYGAKAGTVILMNPKDGAIYSMASYPSFDPRDYADYSDELFRNPAISESFEPGSVYKVVVMASGLDAGVIKPDTKCDICTGPYKIDKYFIDTWDSKYHPDSSMTDVIVHSDNVGMVFVSEKLGEEKLIDYLQKFGMGKITGIDLQGEATPPLRGKKDWNIVDVATASFGQGIAVTPIQMISQVQIIANKGIPVTPQVVDKLKGAGWEEDIKPVEKPRVISQKAAEDITQMMVQAAESGEAKWTYLRGFGVAGKTGTAQIPIAGHYDNNKTIASFIGFAPYDDPKFIMLVTLKEPQSSPWASETAAPLWYSIAKELFLQFGMKPRN